MVAIVLSLDMDKDGDIDGVSSVGDSSKDSVLEGCSAEGEGELLVLTSSDWLSDVLLVEVNENDALGVFVDVLVNVVD
jgi:hypothetical protein